MSDKKARSRSVFSIANELVGKSREAALAAIQLFNNPLVTFKSESFIVLMTIAWTYLLHAYYRKTGVEYRYFTLPEGAKRRRFTRNKDGSFKYWDLGRCLTAHECPLDGDTVRNLEFLIGLRDEIVHRMCPNLDSYFSARYQACCLNYSHYLCEFFGNKYRIDTMVSYSLQLARLEHEQLQVSGDELLLPNVRAYVARFDGALTEEQFNSERFAYRLVFTRKTVNRTGQADRVVEFVPPDSEAAQGIAKDHWVLKETEKPKFLPSQIVAMMKEEGFDFGMHHHIRLWQSMDAKNPARGYGVQIGATWYWYERWVVVVRGQCKREQERALRQAAKASQ